MRPLSYLYSMRQYLFLAILLLALPTWAHQLFTRSLQPMPQSYLQQVRHGSMLQLDQNTQAQLLNKPGKVTLLLPALEEGQQSNWTLELQPATLGPQGMPRVQTASGKAETFKLAFYQGKVSQLPNSMVALTVSDREVIVQIASKQGNYNIGLVKGEKVGSKSSNSLTQGKQVYFAFNERHLDEKPTFHCGTDESLPNYQLGLDKMRQQVRLARQQGRTKNTATCRQVKVAVESDFALYQNNGSDVAATTTFTLALFNLAQVLYNNEGVLITCPRVKIWDQPDPYANLNTFTQLDSLRQIVGGLTGDDLVHLFSGLDLNSTSAGGIAYLGAICTTFNVGISILSQNLAPIPVYTWNSSVVAHELGHNFGSPHTHSCAWQDDLGQPKPIDTCVALQGQCGPGVQPIPRIGTIMSYCHLLASIDLTLGFGPLPGEVLRASFEGEPCLTGPRAPFFTILNPGPVCPGAGPLVLDIDSVGTGINWEWTGPNGQIFAGSNLTIPNPTLADAGVYELRAIIGTCTTLTRSTTVNVTCYPLAQPLYRRQYCAGDSLVMDLQNLTGQTSGATVQLVGMASASTTTATRNAFNGQLSATAGQLRLRTRLPFSGPQYPAGPGPHPLRIQITNALGQRYTLPDTIFVRQAALDLPGLDTLVCQGTTVTTPPIANPFAPQPLRWYSTTSGNAPVFRGPSYTLSNVQDSATIWVEALDTSIIRAGMPYSPVGGNFRNRPSRGLLFQVHQRLVLDSFTIRTDGPGLFSHTIKRREWPTQADYVFQSAPIAIASAGLHRVASGAVLEPGQYYIDAEGTSGMQLWRLTGPNVSFPIRVPNVLTMLTGSFMPDANDVYFYFFDWRVRPQECATNRIPMRAVAWNPASRLRIAVRDTHQLVVQYGGHLVRSASTTWYVNGAPVATGPIFNSQGVGGRVSVTVQLACGLATSDTLVLTSLRPTTKRNYADAIGCYPQPAKDEVTVTWPANWNVQTIKVQDILGRTIVHYPTGDAVKVSINDLAGDDATARQTLKLPALPAGTYLLNLGRGQRKLVVQ